MVVLVVAAVACLLQRDSGASWARPGLAGPVRAWFDPAVASGRLPWLRWRLLPPAWLRCCYTQFRCLLFFPLGLVSMATVRRQR
jgi:hypothetical protein